MNRELEPTSNRSLDEESEVSKIDSARWLDLCTVKTGTIASQHSIPSLGDTTQLGGRMIDHKVNNPDEDTPDDDDLDVDKKNWDILVDLLGEECEHQPAENIFVEWAS